MSIGIGFLGSGAIAREHAEALARIDGVEIRGWADVSLSAARQARSEFGGAYATDDAARILHDDRVDAVYICTWHDSHAEYVERACAAGKSIVLEKPMAITRADLDRVVDAVERSGVILMSAFKFRFYPMVGRARDYIEHPVILTGQVLDNRWPDEYWAQDRITGGGNVLSQGPHAFDLLCHLAGSDPVRIHAEGGAYTHRDTSVVDNLVATIRFASGSIASVAIGDSGTTPLVSKFSFEITDGLRTAQLYNRLSSGVFFDGAEALEISDPAEPGVLPENRAFVAAMRGDVEPPTDHRDGYRASLMAILAVESARDGQTRVIEL